MRFARPLLFFHILLPKGEGGRKPDEGDFLQAPLPNPLPQIFAGNPLADFNVGDGNGSGERGLWSLATSYG